MLKYLRFYRDDPRGRSIIRVWAEKLGKYGPSVQAELARAGLPTDLAYVSLIESGHNPTAQSPAGAAGLWQLVPETARIYGLTVDRWVDERLDPKRSTEAAALYLSDLYQRFGTWELALAAYNMGFGALGKAIRKYNTNDFWELARHEAGIPWETALYVPKVIATAMVMNNRRAFGIADVSPASPVAFDTVLVPAGTHLSRVAAAAEVALPQLEQLNPEYLESRIPPADKASASRPVRVPSGKGSLVAQRLAREVGGLGAEFETYRVRFGDTPQLIAAERGVSEERLVALNGLGRSERLEAGTLLLVPGGSGTREAPPPPASGAGAETLPVVVTRAEFSYPDRRRVFYRVRAGDGLEEIARVFGVTKSELVSWNAVDPEARLQPEMVLQLFVPKAQDLSRVRYIPAEQARILVAGSEEFFEYFEGQQGRKRIRVTARAGDTLQSIGKRYGMSVGSMERINQRSNRDPLNPGETVIVYVPERTTSRVSGHGEAQPELRPLPPLPPEPTERAREEQSAAPVGTSVPVSQR